LRAAIRFFFDILTVIFEVKPPAILFLLDETDRLFFGTSVEEYAARRASSAWI
jgi:hypothetical protein